MSAGRAILGLFAAGALAHGAPEPTGRSFFSAALGKEIACQIFLPAVYEAERGARLPVVYLLHGRGGDLHAWTAVVPEIERLIAAQRVPPFIAIMPDAPANKRAGYYVDSEFAGAGELPAGERVETAFTRDLVAAVDATYRTRPDRAGRIVAGFSMGGYGALRFALAHPEVFGAAIVLSPAVYVPLPPRASSTREFGAFGKGRKIFDEAIYREKNYPALLPAFAAAKRPLAMFIAVGDREQALPDPAEAVHDLDYEAHTLYNRVRRVPGINAQLRVLGGGHNWDVWRPAFAEGLVFAFAQLGAARN